MTAQAFEPRGSRENFLAAAELANLCAFDMGHAERRQKSLSALHIRPILVDHDRGRPRLDALVDQLLEISDRPSVARFHPGDGVMRRGLVGIDRCGEADPIWAA